MPGFVVWFTGLSGAGKSTLAAMLSAELRARGVHVEVLDGDEVRTYLSKGLGFSREDRDTNVRRIGYVAKLVARSGACAVTAAISPYKATRDEQRRQIPAFVEVYCACAIPALAARDPKGLYAKALAGEIRHFTGVDDPYEPPDAPEVTLRTDEESPDESLAKILGRLEELGHVARDPRGDAGEPVRPAAAPGWPGLAAPHGGELIDRRAHGPAREALAARAAGLPAIDLDARAALHLDQIASGALSPLRGFMGSKDYLRVVREMRLERGLPWPLPITLALPEDQAAPLRPGQAAALRAPDGRLVAVIEVDDVWRPDLSLEARALHGTTDPAHPGVARLRSAGPVYVGGEILSFDRAAPPLSPERDLTPAESRARLAERGLRRVVGSLSVAPQARGAGPREAILDAIIAKNHGASHVLVAPDPAALALFDEIAPVELGITPLCLEDALSSAGGATAPPPRRMPL